MGLWGHMGTRLQRSPGHISAFLHFYICTVRRFHIVIYIFAFLHLYTSRFLHVYISTFIHFRIFTLLYFYFIRQTIHDAIYIYIYIHIIYIYIFICMHMTTAQDIKHMVFVYLR